MDRASTAPITEIAVGSHFVGGEGHVRVDVVEGVAHARRSRLEFSGSGSTTLAEGDLQRLLLLAEQVRPELQEEIQVNFFEFCDEYVEVARGAARVRIENRRGRLTVQPLLEIVGLAIDYLNRAVPLPHAK